MLSRQRVHRKLFLQLTYSLLSTLLLISVSTKSFAQTGNVKGKVVDALTKEGLPSATVLLLTNKQLEEERNTGKITGKLGRIAKKDGSFEFMNVTAGNYTLRVNYVGYKITSSRITVKENETTTQNIEMQLDIKGLDEVVIVGAAEQRFKSQSEVAVSRVDAAQITQTNSYDNLAQLLAGKAAGVRVTPGSGNVGGGIRFDVRAGAGLFGSGQPVIIIDGVRKQNGEVGGDLTGGQYFSSTSNLNPDDIASIEILKGPAASALYGTSGSNGVILIKTKRGTGRTTDIGGYNYAYKLTVGQNSQAQKYTEDYALSYKDANNTFRTGPFTEHYFNIGGATGEYNYFASVSKRNEDGIQRNNSLERNSMRANFGINPSDKVTMNFSTNYTNSLTHLPQNDNNILGYLGNTVLVGPVSAGGFGSYAFTDSLAVEGINTSNNSNEFLGSFEIQYRPIENLTFHGSIGYNSVDNKIQQIYPANLNYTNVGVENGYKYIARGNSKTINIDLSGSYFYRIGDDIGATTTVGMQTQSTNGSELTASRQNFPTELVSDIGSAAKLMSLNEGFFDAREAGIFLSQDFSFDDDKYLMSFGVRNDYASSIGEKAPAVFYPRASGAVRLDKLDIFPTDINLMKFRVAYGQSGILPGPLDGSGLRWSGTQSGSGVGGVISIIGNPSIKPESVSEIEFGLEMEYMNRHGFDVTYYITRASNSIIGVNNGPSTGLTASTVPKNIGSIKGSGIEAQVYTTPIYTPDIALRLDLKWNYNTNEVVSLGEAQPIYQDQNAIVPGQRRAAFYTYKVLGALFDDATGEYIGPKVDTVRSLIGYSTPPNSGSFSIDMTFLKDFRLNILTEWALGGMIHNLTRIFQVQFANDKEYNEISTQLGLNPTPVPGVAVLQPGTDAYRAAAEKFAQLDPSVDGSGYFESSDFLRIREVSLRYDMTKLLSDLISDNVIKSIALSVSAHNLALFKKYRGPDVELNTSGASRSVYRGQDFLTLQNPRVIYGTLSLGF